MKKLFIVLLVLSVLFSCNREPKVVTQEEATSYLKNYLDEEYKEEFIIIEENRSQVIYHFLVTPKKYIGTSKEKDDYYKERMHVRLKWDKTGEWIRGVERDPWKGIFIDEELNDLLVPVLQSIFGKKVRPIMDIDIDPSLSLSEYLRKATYLKGRIFIFDRIEKKEDLIKYKEKIFKFLTQLEDMTHFFSLELGIYILDERILAPSYNSEIKEELIKLGDNHTSSKDFIIEREKLLSQLNDEYKKMSETEKNEAIYKLKRGELDSYYKKDYIYYTMLYHTIFFKNTSPRKDSFSFYQEPPMDNPEEILLYNSMEIYYGQQNAKMKELKEHYNTPWIYDR